MCTRWTLLATLMAFGPLVCAQEDASPPVHGVVLRPGGALAAGAQVTMLEALRTVPGVPAVADESGRFELPRPSPVAAITDRDHPHPPAVIMATLADEGLVGVSPLVEEGEILVQLAPGGWVEVRALGEDGSPVEGADLFVHFRAFGSAYTLPESPSSGADGVVRVGPLPVDCEVSVSPGLYSSQIMRDSWAEVNRQVGVGWGGVLDLPPVRRVRVAPGEAVELPPLVLMAGGRSFGGTVVDQDGRPVAGARVICDAGISREPLATRRILETTTGEDGTFRFEGVHACGRVGVLAASEDGGLAYGLPVDPDAALQLTLSLRAPVTLTGQVVDLQGKPAAGILVAVSTEEFGHVAFAAENPYWVGAGTRTDEDGRWEISKLVAGFQYEVRARSHDLGSGLETVIAEEDVSDIVVVVGLDQ